MQYGRELLKGSTDTLLLSLLSQEAMYGYQIIKEINTRSRGYFKFREGTLYPALHRLEQSGLVVGMWQELPSGQVRRYYHITEKGRAFLEAKMAEWRGFAAAVDSVMQPARA
ncbi:MAG: helix-turn-helix transcriptional regulator [Chloroflexi bacterium]|nr:helix-turn-helix transcriptional regulator [Chloroflexota bacterium]